MRVCSIFVYHEGAANFDFIVLFLCCLMANKMIELISHYVVLLS